MSDFVIHPAMLEFIAGKIAAAGQSDERTAALAALLRAAAADVAAGRPVVVPADRLELAARAFAGFAAVMQREILPEAVAHGNAAGEAQIRGAVDAAMAAVSLLLSRAAAGEAGAATVLEPPPSPAGIKVPPAG